MSKHTPFFKPTPRKRLSKSLPTRACILIVCEGEKTELLYFKDFKLPAVTIISGGGRNNEALIDFTIQEIKKAKNNDSAYDQVWCVFDRDSFPKEKINAAIHKSKTNKIRLAISNECFELWYLLHFDYITDGRSRSDYATCLKDKLKPYNLEYTKQSLYPYLKDKLDNAIKNAKNLINSHGITVDESKLTLSERYPGLVFCEDNPFTSVHDLVSVLRSEQDKCNQ